MIVTFLEPSFVHYQDINQPLLLKAAEHSVSLHLNKLRKDGKAEATGQAYIRCVVLCA